MAYEFIYTQHAMRDIRKLDTQTKERIKTALERYKTDPLAFADKLTNPTYGTYRFRIGDYRVIFDIDDTKIVVLRVGHRREIYRGI
jgi:mRNA interferase RelE/StbE